jgi:hypothetical protein
MQVIRLSQSLKEQLLNIIDLHQGYFGEDCQTLLAAIQGVYCEKHIDKSCKDIIRDHSTVLYSIKTMKHALQVQDKLVKSIHTKYGELEAEGA